MKLILAHDLDSIKEKYIHVIDNTPDIDKEARWEYGKHPDDILLQTYIDNNEMYAYVDGNEILGMVAMTMYQGEDYESIQWGKKFNSDEVAALHLVTVCPEYARRGIGRKMLNEAIEVAKEAGKKAVRVDTLDSNIPAQHLYPNLGFAYAGKQNRFEETLGWTDFLYYEYLL